MADDVVIVRTAARHWSVSDKYGAFDRTWHHEEQGRRKHTLVTLRNPIMDSIRRLGLHLRQEEMPPDRWTRHCKYGLLRRHSDSYIGKPGCRSTTVSG